MTDLSFYDLVHQVVRLIPPGRITSYGAVAAYLGSKGSSRMVGYAMNNSFSAIPKVPAHRVVNRQGLLTGKNHFGSPNMMQQLLQNEGVKVEEDQVVNFKVLFWDPSVELTLER